MKCVEFSVFSDVVWGCSYSQKLHCLWEFHLRPCVLPSCVFHYSSRYFNF